MAITRYACSRVNSIIFSRFVPVLILFVGFAGCGYHFKGFGLEAPDGVQTVAIPMLENKTTRPGIETFFTGDLAFEFTRSKVLAVVTEKRADAVLNGSIVSLKTDVAAHTTDFASDERRATITLSLVLKRKDGKTIWADKALSDDEIYKVSDDRAVTDSNERTALQIISARLAEKIHNRILEDF